MIKTIYHFELLTGGSALALDSVDGNSLMDKDRSFTIVGDALYVHQLDADSGLAENSPAIIAPDTNAGTKRWILLGTRYLDADLTFTDLGTGFQLSGGSGTSKALNVGANATLPGQDTGTAAPVAGTWARGWIRWNTTPTAGAPVGWVCITAGTPGTWEPFGMSATNGFWQFSDIITGGPWVDVRTFGAVCDGSTDDHDALQDAIDAAPNGTKLLIPGVCAFTGELDFSGKTYITVEGMSWANNGTPATASGLKHLGGNARSALWLVGATYFTLRNLEIYSTSTTPPKVVLALGRSDAGSYGWHSFDHVRITGYATQALVYSIASEVNTWNAVAMQLEGGGGKYVFYTSQSDSLSVSPGDFTASTNLSLFMNNFWIWNLVDDADAAAIYINAAGSTGDMYFRHGSGASRKGSHIQINVVDDGADAASGPFVFDGIRMEDETTIGIPHGMLLTSAAAAAVVDGLQLSNSSLLGTDSVLYAEDGITLDGLTMRGNKSNPVGTRMLDAYNMQRCFVEGLDGKGSRVRNSSYGNVFIRCGAVTFSGAASPYNTLVMEDYATPGIKYYGPVTQSLSGQGIDDAPFTSFVGYSAGGAVGHITQTQGDGAVDGPKAKVASPGWTFVGMVRMAVNDTDYWMPYYSYTP